MTMRNAFEELATDRTLRLVLAAVNYARDINDRMRVIVDNTVVTTTTLTAGPYMTGAATRTERLLYDPNTPFMVDDRDEMRAITQANARTRRQGWTIT